MLLQFCDTLSLSSVRNACTSLWKCSGVTQEFLSTKLIRKLLLTFGITILEPLVKKLQEKLVSENSNSLSADHTYKFVKKLTVGKNSNVDQKVLVFFLKYIFLHYKIHVSAQLLDICNDNGHVISHHIVPDGSHVYVEKAITTDILPFQSTPSKCFYSDKSVADQNLQTTFNTYYDAHNIKGKTVVLQGNLYCFLTYIQDIYHCQQRIVHLLPKSHSDYGSAVANLTKIFSELKKDTSVCKYKNMQEFKQALIGII